MFEPDKSGQEYDRITQILQQQSAPTMKPLAPFERANAFLSALATGKNFNDVYTGQQTDVYNQERQAQADEVQKQNNLLTIFEKKKAAGDAQAKALDDKLNLFTGGDAAGNAMFLEALHNDPEAIDPNNSFQIMTKLAKVAKQTGYVSPEQKMRDLDLQSKRLGLSKTQAEINALGAKGQKPMSDIGKLTYDYQSGLIDKDAYDSAITQKTKGKNGGQLPVGALKLQNEALDAIGTVGSVNSRLDSATQKLTDGTLNLGPVSNFYNQGLNYAGMSTEESRNLASFQSDLEKIRNDSLRLNKGVQTEGDAVRAWNEITKNINDPKLVAQRLQEIKGYNERAAALKGMEVDQIRANYGLEPLDTTSFLQGGAIAGAPAQTVTVHNPQTGETFEIDANDLEDAKAEGFVEQ